MPTTMTTHKCYRCEPETDAAASQGPFGTIEATRSTGGDEIFFASGYSAREISQKHVREYVNNVSRAIKRPELTVWVGYAVAKTPVYTTFGPDDAHATVHRVYWRPLDA
jgi:hypothetical protein